MKVYAFDFDGTLTNKDTFIEFIKYTHGYFKTLLGFFLHIPLLLFMKFRLVPNWKVKQIIFSWFFKGVPIDEFNELCNKFAKEKYNDILRYKGIETIEGALQARDEVIIISASIVNWVEPFFYRYNGKVKVQGTLIDVRNGVVTGKFLTKNCYGKEKIKRLNEFFPNRYSYHLIAFGDSKGDKYLLSEADEAFFKPFRRPIKEKFMEMLRFIIVGASATVLQYLVYILLLKMIYVFTPQQSNTIAYLVSFMFNYIASTKFTFKVKSTAKRGLGFAFSHVINYLLQTVLLTIFLHLGLLKQYAMLPVFIICVPVNFLLVRMFLRKGIKS